VSWSLRAQSVFIVKFKRNFLHSEDFSSPKGDTVQSGISVPCLLSKLVIEVTAILKP